ncbi:MAG: 16S rRNA (uracil(1498)-N(3))-methyltransferase [Pseudomonadota bacterium]
MRIPRIYTQANLHHNQSTIVKAQAHKHIKDVLRLKVSDSIILFDGSGYDYRGKITEINKESLSVLLEQQIKIENESPLKIHLLQPLCRSEKMDWCIQKAVELGVSRITPYTSSRTNINIPNNRLSKKLEHWHSVIQSACEQSGRALLPSLESPIDFNTAINEFSSDYLKVIASPIANQNEINLVETTPEECVLAIGPEGGFSDQELKHASNAEFIDCLLGPRVLRLETAVIAALTLLQIKLGDLN